MTPVTRKRRQMKRPTAQHGIIVAVGFIFIITLYWKRDSAKRDSAKRDSAKRDSAKRDSAKRDSAKRDSAKRDSAKQDSAKRDSAKRDRTAFTHSITGSENYMGQAAAGWKGYKPGREKRNKSRARPDVHRVGPSESDPCISQYVYNNKIIQHSFHKSVIC